MSEHTVVGHYYRICTGLSKKSPHPVTSQKNLAGQRQLDQVKTGNMCMEHITKSHVHYL